LLATASPTKYNHFFSPWLHEIYAKPTVGDHRFARRDPVTRKTIFEATGHA
jgi:hypothetical protein